MSLKETKFYTTKQYPLEVEAEAEEPFRVALLGDLHISPIVSEKQCYAAYLELSKIEELELIIIQGDMVDSPTELYDTESVKKLTDTLKMCARIAPTVVVLGGHDIVIPRDPAVEMDVIPIWKEVCEECGVKLLLDEWYETEHVAVFGLYQNAQFVFGKNRKRKDDPKVMERKLAELGESKKLSREFPGKVRWFAAHAPLLNRGGTRALADFQVASFGHTHGGCVPILIDSVMDRLGKNGGLVSPEKKPFPKMVRGRTTLPTGTELIINSGMIATHYSTSASLQYLNGLKKGEVTEVTLKPPSLSEPHRDASAPQRAKDEELSLRTPSDSDLDSDLPAIPHSRQDDTEFEEDYDGIDDREEEEEERRRKEREERIQEILEAEKNKRRRGRKRGGAGAKRPVKKTKKRKRPKRELDEDYDEDWNFDDDFEDEEI